MKQWTFFGYGVYIKYIIATVHKINEYSSHILHADTSSQEQYSTFESAVKLWTSSHHKSGMWHEKPVDFGETRMKMTS